MTDAPNLALEPVRLAQVTVTEGDAVPPDQEVFADFYRERSTHTEIRKVPIR